MRTLAHAALIATVGVVAFAVGARNGSVGAVKFLEAQARHRAAQRAAVAADIAADGET